ncbi:SigE family RNA polymerase sigma factor (plasmid) [Embleya sp. NBC_00888]|uniref:SigE family RNA polymerase sigma factor n=1 Tax=Embleya sp. NBC_00888 TaxID=2975960 RepID=UPI002F90C75B|nr:SigE family RNA polymerase sigma factor [Embleya sp. NBC_00888]
MRTNDEADFDAFVVARGAALRRTAYLLCGDWHAAEDLVQTTLTSVYIRWKRIREPGARGEYARKVLIRAYIDTTRKKSNDEAPIANFPDMPTVRDGDPDVRVALMAALAQVSPGYRALLVLRFWEDQSIEQTAALVGRSPSAVRSGTARGLVRLRALLGDELAELPRP